MFLQIPYCVVKIEYLGTENGSLNTSTLAELNTNFQEFKYYILTLFKDYYLVFLIFTVFIILYTNYSIYYFNTMTLLEIYFI